MITEKNKPFNVKIGSDSDIRHIQALEAQVATYRASNQAMISHQMNLPSATPMVRIKRSDKDSSLVKQVVLTYAASLPDVYREDDE